jgi:hypothetical protein
MKVKRCVCGEVPKIYSGFYPAGLKYFERCEKCGREGKKSKSKKEAIKAWEICKIQPVEQPIKHYNIEPGKSWYEKSIRMDNIKIAIAITVLVLLQIANVVLIVWRLK